MPGPPRDFRRSAAARSAPASRVLGRARLPERAEPSPLLPDPLPTPSTTRVPVPTRPSGALSSPRRAGSAPPSNAAREAGARRR